MDDPPGGPRGTPDGRDGADPPARRRTVLTALALSGVATAGAWIGVTVVARAGLPPSATEEGEVVGDLWRLLLGIAGAVAGVVVVFLGVAAVQAWRARGGGPEPEQVEGDLRFELVYTAVPLVIVAVVFAVSLRASEEVDTDVPDDAVAVDVTAFQWGWRFDYEDGPSVTGASPDEPELVLPVDRTVVLDLRSADVVHSFFAPSFRTKLDVVPGRLNQLVVTPDEVGTYRGHCAEFCGLDHARMGFTVRVVSGDAYERWIEAG